MSQSKQHYYLSTMKKIIYITPLLALLSCGTPTTPNEKAPGHSHENGEHDHSHNPEGLDEATELLYADVMKVHDEVMPRMEDIQEYKSEMELEMGDEKADYILEELEKADEAMMAWMREFKTPESMPKEERQSYLQSEKIKIENVKTIMLNSLEMAEAFSEGDEE